jgi:hypothetical protein
MSCAGLGLTYRPAMEVCAGDPVRSVLVPHSRNTALLHRFTLYPPDQILMRQDTEESRGGSHQRDGDAGGSRRTKALRGHPVDQTAQGQAGCQSPRRFLRVAVGHRYLSKSQLGQCMKSADRPVSWLVEATVAFGAAPYGDVKAALAPKSRQGGVSGQAQ